MVSLRMTKAKGQRKVKIQRSKVKGDLGYDNMMGRGVTLLSGLWWSESPINPEHTGLRSIGGLRGDDAVWVFLLILVFELLLVCAGGFI